MSFALFPLISPFPLLLSSFCVLPSAFSPQSPLSIGSLGRSAPPATRRRSAREAVGNHSGILRGSAVTQRPRLPGNSPVPGDYAAPEAEGAGRRILIGIFWRIVMGQSRRVGWAVLCTPRLTQHVVSARRGLPALPLPATTGALLWRIHERRKCRRNKGIGNSTGQPPARSLPSPA